MSGSSPCLCPGAQGISGALGQRGALERFLRTFEWVVEEITACSDFVEKSAQTVPSGRNDPGASDPAVSVGVGTAPRSYLRRYQGRHT